MALTLEILLDGVGAVRIEHSVTWDKNDVTHFTNSALDKLDSLRPQRPGTIGFGSGSSLVLDRGQGSHPGDTDAGWAE